MPGNWHAACTPWSGIRSSPGWTANTISRCVTGVVAPPVPEPETYAMLLAGLGLLAGVARRKAAGNAA